MHGKIRLLLLFIATHTAQAFLLENSRTRRKRLVAHVKREKELSCDDEEVFYVAQKGIGQNDSQSLSNTPQNSSEANYMDDLTPPTVNLKRDSILFSDNPSTQRKNEALDLWKFCKKNVPSVITGAWPWRRSDVANENPVGALYNIAFVRLPVIGVGIAYINNVLHGHPLIMDIGQGPTEISPIIVLSVLALILA